MGLKVIVFVCAMTIGHVVARMFLHIGLLYLLVAPALGLLIFGTLHFAYLRFTLGDAGFQKKLDDQKAERPGDN